MSKLELIRALYDYNEHANNRVLDVASRLSADEFSRAGGTSFGGIERNLGHVAAAQIAWLQRWTMGGNTESTVQIARIRGRDDIAAAYKRSHADLREFLGGLTDERLDSVLAYRDSKGDAYERVLWQLMLHVANHGSYHRGETAMALSALGHSPGDLDYVYFEMARDGGRVR
jgi:uncharacterized damage-inducible protein DinB